MANVAAPPKGSQTCALSSHAADNIQCAKSSDMVAGCFPR